MEELGQLYLTSREKGLEAVTETLKQERNEKTADRLFHLLFQMGETGPVIYANIGLGAEDVGNCYVAEKAYRRALAYYNSYESKVDADFSKYRRWGLKDSFECFLGALLRRKHDGNIEVVQLLEGKAKAGNFYARVNLALFWINERGDDEDWERLEKHIEKIKDDDVELSDYVWSSRASSGDSDAYLVILLMLRHRKIIKSDFGTIDEVYEKAKVYYPAIPKEWLQLATDRDKEE